MYLEQIRQFQRTLRQLDKWFDAAESHAKEKSFDANILLGCRLAPDQLPLSRQVQMACDTAKLSASRITGREAPSHADTETTVAELRARVASVIAYLEGFGEKDFTGSATRPISTPRWPSPMLGADYFREHAIPNFYFHSTTTYAILRHNGVNVGKKDYLGPLTFQPA